MSMVGGPKSFLPLRSSTAGAAPHTNITLRTENSGMQLTRSNRSMAPSSITENIDRERRSAARIPQQTSLHCSEAESHPFLTQTVPRPVTARSNGPSGAPRQKKKQYARSISRRSEGRDGAAEGVRRLPWDGTLTFVHFTSHLA